MTIYFFTLCISCPAYDCGQLMKCLITLIKSLEDSISDYKLFVCANYDIHRISNKNIEYLIVADINRDNELSYKLNVYKMLSDKYHKNFVYISVSTVVLHNMDYIDTVDNYFIEEHINNRSITLINSHFWKLNSGIFNKLLDYTENIESSSIGNRHKLRGLLSYYIYRYQHEEKLYVQGNNYMKYAKNIIINKSTERNTLKELKCLYYDNNFILRSVIHGNKEIHSFRIPKSILISLLNNKKITNYLLNPINNFMWLGGKNFGDGVVKVFWDKIIGKKQVYNHISSLHYITIGSILCKVNQNSIVFGSGFISADGDLGGGNFKSNSSRLIHKPHNVIAVRGPRTREKLLKFGVECPENYGDPLILLPCICKKIKHIDDEIVGIIPHYIDKDKKTLSTLINYLRNNGYIVNLVNIMVGDNYEELITQVIECKYIISSSLHGVILGIIYMKKTIYTSFSCSVMGGDYKFYDFFESLNIKYNMINTFDAQLINNTINVDYNKLVNTGINMIRLAPFIDPVRKKNLISSYNNFYFSK